MELTKLFAASAHRWQMGLRRATDLAEFFQPHDETGSAMTERRDSLKSHPERYLAELLEAAVAIRETLRLLSVSEGVVPEPQLSATGDAPLQLGQTYEPDAVWLAPDAAGDVRLVGGVVCFPSSWSLPDKLGQPLSQVHAVVPGLNATLGRPIDSFLRKLVPGDVWRRENWGLSGDDRRNHHPCCPRTPLEICPRVDQVWIRIEHQLLLKLPQSGGILFGIRLEIMPLAAVVSHSLARRQLLHQLETMSPLIAEYKGLTAARSGLIDLLQSAESVTITLPE
ncbi:DUF3445 domain-containing protein [bacterium]|nr:DUF3445 domain-containing protein [bacterium]